MPMFLTLLLVGFCMLMFSLLFDHDHDFDHGEMGDGDGHGMPRWLSLKVIAVFLTAFGAAGAIARFYDFSMMASSLIAIAAGLVLGFVVYQLLGLVYAQQASSHVTAGDVLHQRGHVTVRIAPGQVGEVACTVKGSQYSYLAQAQGGGEIAEGASVEIVETLGERVLVRPVTH